VPTGRVCVGARDAYAEWEAVEDEEEKPWVDIDDDDDLDAAGSVVRTD